MGQVTDTSIVFLRLAMDTMALMLPHMLATKVVTGKDRNIFMVA